MKKVLKCIFIMFLISISILYVKDKVNDINLTGDFMDINSNRFIMSLFNTPIYDDNNISIKDVSYVNTSSKKIINKDYLFYIFNTHQKEEYEEGTNKPYSIKCNVVTASYMLRDLLKEKGYNSLVEDRDVMKIVNNNGWSYSSTYTVTKDFVEEIKNKYPTIKYFIDIHRDGAPISATRVDINGKSYAKIMFTIGKDRDNLEDNLVVVEKLRKYLNDNYEGILRNNFYRENEDFNQYLDSNMFLIEVGGQYNSLDEVYNSIKAISDAFSYLEGI